MNIARQQTQDTGADMRVTSEFQFNGIPYRVIASFIGDDAYGSHVQYGYEGVTEVPDLPEANGSLKHISDNFLRGKVIEELGEEAGRASLLRTELETRELAFKLALKREMREAQRETDAYLDRWEAEEGRTHWSRHPDPEYIW